MLPESTTVFHVNNKEDLIQKFAESIDNKTTSPKTSHQTKKWFEERDFIVLLNCKEKDIRDTAKSCFGSVEGLMNELYWYCQGKAALETLQTYLFNPEQDPVDLPVEMALVRRMIELLGNKIPHLVEKLRKHYKKYDFTNEAFEKMLDGKSHHNNVNLTKMKEFRKEWYWRQSKYKKWHPNIETSQIKWTDKDPPKLF